MSYSRENPSPRYRELLEMYSTMHNEGDSSHGIPPEKMFPGQSLPPHAGRIKQMLQKFGASTLLDYGCGKGLQYQPMKVSVSGVGDFDSIPAFWDVSVTCYDPGYAPHSTYPEGDYDAVICTDVLEHCPEEDIPWIVGELFRFANKMVYANIACYPAQKTLPNGENAHVTIQPVDWWKEYFRQASEKNGNIPYLVIVEEAENGQIKAGAFASPGVLG